MDDLSKINNKYNKIVKKLTKDFKNAGTLQEKINIQREILSVNRERREKMLIAFTEASK